jgi:hypothetical protein
MRHFVWGCRAVALLTVAACMVGCGSDNPLGSMGGQIFGDVASKQAGNMMSGGAQKKAQQQQAAAQQQQQQQTAAQASQQQAGAYKAPAMEMTGTLAEKKATDGTAAGWSFTEQQSTVATAVDVSAVEKDARKLAGKKVTLSGRYDTLGTGAFVVEKVAAVAQ